MTDCGGDTLAELYEASATRLTRWVVQRFALPPADAEEIVQEAFMLLICTAAAVRSADAWLVHVISRLARKRCRSHSVTDASLELSSRDADPALVVEVRRLLATLPRQWQEILRLRYMEEMSAPEVAASLGLNPDHVRQISRRALLELRARLNNQPETLRGLAFGIGSREILRPVEVAKQSIDLTIRASG